jgi:hypothetical protein
MNTSSPGGRRVTLAAVISVFGLVAVACGAGSTDSSGPGIVPASETDSATYEYVIPLGAGDALDAGTPLEILPAELEVEVGESIRIVNNDDRGHNVGPFFVGARETLSQRFSSAGEFVGVCTVHPSGEFVLIVNS